MEKPESLGLICLFCGNTLKVSRDRYYCENCGNEFSIKRKGDIDQAANSLKIKQLNEEISGLQAQRQAKLKESLSIRRRISFSGISIFIQLLWVISFVYLLAYILLSIISSPNLPNNASDLARQLIDFRSRYSQAISLFLNSIAIHAIAIVLFILTGIYWIRFPGFDKEKMAQKRQIAENEVQQIEHKLLLLNKELSRLWGE